MLLITNEDRALFFLKSLLLTKIWFHSTSVVSSHVYQLACLIGNSVVIFWLLFLRMDFVIMWRPICWLPFGGMLSFTLSFSSQSTNLCKGAWKAIWCQEIFDGIFPFEPFNWFSFRHLLGVIPSFHFLAFASITVMTSQTFAFSFCVLVACVSAFPSIVFCGVFLVKPIE